MNTVAIYLFSHPRICHQRQWLNVSRICSVCSDFPLTCTAIEDHPSWVMNWKFLTLRGVATCQSTPQHLQGNGQCERANQTTWRTIKMLLHSQSLREDRWEEVLPKALYAIRSLKCVTTNETPHKRLFSLPGRAMTGKSVPTWLMSPGPVLLGCFVRTKGEPSCDEVEYLDANPTHTQWWI